MIIILSVALVPLVIGFILDCYTGSDLGRNFGAPFLSVLNGNAIWLCYVFISSGISVAIFSLFLVALSVLFIIVLYVIRKIYESTVEDLRKRILGDETT